MKPPETTNTSPPTPRFTDEAWRNQPAPPLAADLYAELRALKAKLASGRPSGQPVDSEAERVYLAACAAAKSRVGPLAGARTHDLEEPNPGYTARRRGALLEAMHTPQGGKTWPTRRA